jgi:hypothetical protein
LHTRLRALLTVLVMVASFAGPASAAVDQEPALIAQATQGQSTVNGTITDAAGTALAGAVVTIEGAGTHQTATTDGHGAYTFTVPPGIYAITIVKGGYQSGSTSVTAVADTTVTANGTLTAASLSNLQVIGRTSASANSNQAARFNISSSAQGNVTQATILDRSQPNLNNIVTEIPGVTVNHSSSNPNTNFYIRGTAVEARTFIDGHPVANGVSGTTLTLFANSAIFGGIDVLKGAGLNGPQAGYSGVGEANLRTLDFTSHDSGFLQGGIDQYLGTFYSAIADVNIDKFSILLGKSYYGYLGPTNQQLVNVFGTFAAGNALNVPNYNYSAYQTSGNLVAWQGDFSNDYGLASYLGKIRYKFSDATSIQGSFLGLYGNFFPQGGAYGQYGGTTVVPYCINSVGGKNVPSYSAAGCGATSIYNAPSAQSLVGQNVPVYTFYPGSTVQFNQPVYDFDFKTTIGNDTLLLRPYSAIIQRYINGQNEPDQFGYNGGTYEVLNNANCQVTFVAAKAGVGAKGPCLAANSSYTAAPYIGSDTTPILFNTGQLPAGYVCSVATPCYTSPTQITNSGAYAFGSPYTTFETDNLFGYTFSYIHPVQANTYSASFDHYYDQSQALVNDASALAPGCQFTVGGGTLPTTPITYNGQTYGPQPACTLPTGVSRPSPISVPSTFSSVSSLSLAAQFQLTPKLEFDFGNYFTYYAIQAQREDPGLLTAFANAYHTTSAAPVLLVGVTNAAAHYDPHFGLLFRPTRDWSLRFTGGSSIAIPYASQVSGLGTINQGISGTTVSFPAPYLKPENVVAYDIGSDYRLKNGAILSGDLYNNVIYNAWAQPKIAIAQPPGVNENAAGYFQTVWVNTSEEILQGIEFAAGDEPRVGFGGKVALSMERGYYLNLPQNIVQSPINPTTGQPIVTPILFFNGEQISGLPYTRGYAEVRWAGRHNELFRLGMDYEGNNNAYNSPAFVMFDTTLRLPLPAGFALQITGQNITNQTNSSYLAQGVYLQGRVQVGGTYLPTGVSYQNPGTLGSSGFVNPGFQTFSMAIQKQF